MNATSGPDTIREKRDAAVNFKEADLDFSSDELEISRDIALTFDIDNEISCRKIIIRNCSVEIANLNLRGTITVQNGQLTLTDSHIHDASDSVDYILAIENKGYVRATRCVLETTQHFGICIDGASEFDFLESALKDVKLYGVVLSGLSKFRAGRSRFIDMTNDAVFVTERCSVELIGCEFSGRQKRALTVNGGDYVALDSAVIMNCALSSMFVSRCRQFIMTKCKILDCRHTAVYLDSVTGVVKKTVITSAEGNGINLSHDTKCVISKCKISKTTFPPIAICESSFGRIKGCDISESQMCGLIVRGNSKAAVKETQIRKMKLFGVAISDSKDVVLSKSLVIDCDEAAVACYNNSTVKIKASNLVSAKIGIDVFTGAFVNVDNTSIIGMQQTAVFMHQAGSGFFNQLVVSTDAIPKDEDVANAIDRMELAEIRDDIDPERIFKMETKRSVVCAASFVVGLGRYELAANVDAKEAPSGKDATPARCRVCNAITTEALFDRCGHALYCRACWDALETKPEQCDLCLMPVSRLVAPVYCSREGEDGVCGICFTNSCDTVILPCGHAACWECCVQWFTTKTDCPFCRERNARPQLAVSYE